jgi:hypothetical protein
MPPPGNRGIKLSQKISGTASSCLSFSIERKRHIRCSGRLSASENVGRRISARTFARRASGATMYMRVAMLG